VRVRCGQGHWFNDERGVCDHLDGGEPCGYPPEGTGDTTDRLRAIVAGEDPVLAVAQLDLDDDPEVSHEPGAADEARARLAAAVRRKKERGATKQVVVVPDGRRVICYKRDQVGNDLTCVLRWCSTHDEPTWVYDDGSFSCPHELSVGWSPDPHELTDAPWETTPAPSGGEQ
jgi:hypothetical protein